MWDKIKQHPWIVGGAVGLILLVLVFSGSSSNSTATDATAASTVDPNADQLTAYMASLNQQGAIAQLQANSQDQQTAASLQATQLAAGVQENANTLAAQVAEFQTAAAAQTQQYGDSIQLQGLQSSNQTALAIQQSNNATAVQQAQISAQTNQYDIGQIVGLEQSISANQTAVESQSISAQKDIATQSWFSKIF